MTECIEEILKTGSVLRERNPLIHCITSPIAINDCANAVLAVGARPICAEHPAEVRGITAISAFACPTAPFSTSKSVPSPPQA